MHIHIKLHKRVPTQLEAVLFVERTTLFGELQTGVLPHIPGLHHRTLYRPSGLHMSWHCAGIHTTIILFILLNDFQPLHISKNELKIVFKNQCTHSEPWTGKRRSNAL